MGENDGSQLEAKKVKEVEETLKAQKDQNELMRKHQEVLHFI